MFFIRGILQPKNCQEGGLDLTAINLSASYKLYFGAKPFEVNIGMFITDSLLISNRFRIKCFDSSISIPNFDSLFTYDKMLVLVTKTFIEIKSSQETQ